MAGLSISKSLEAHLLRPLVTRADVVAGTAAALESRLAAVVVFPAHVTVARATLPPGTDLRVIAAIGFPFGQETRPVKRAAIEQARLDGADEVAVMLDHSLLAGGDLDAARRELDAVLSGSWWSSLVSTKGQAQLTIVAETMLIDAAVLEPIAADLHDSPAGFLQTSSGWDIRQVTEPHLRHLRDVVPDDVGIKAVGGIATLGAALDIINAGAVRVGSGSAAAIVSEEMQQRAARSGS